MPKLEVLLSLVALAAVFASCAGTEDEGAPQVDAGGDVESPRVDGGDASDAPPAITCADTAWCPTPTSGIDARVALTAVWGSGKNDVWVVGSSGAIGHFDGATWATVPSGTNQTLRAVWGSGANDVWIASTPDVVLHGAGWQSSSATFTAAPEVPRVVPNVVTLTLAIWGTSASDVWLGGEAIPQDWEFSEHAHGWRMSDPDGGVAWENMAVARITDRVTIRSYWGSGPSDVWAVGGDDVEIFNDDGTTSVSSTGKTFHTSGADAGPPNWIERDSRASAILYAVWGSGPDDVWAVGRRGTILHTTRDAARWDVVASPTTEHLRSLWGSGPNDVWAVGDRGMILHYDGVRWTESSVAFLPDVRPNLYGVWGSGPDDVWAVGELGLVHFAGAHAEGGAP